MYISSGCYVLNGTSWKRESPMLYEREAAAASMSKEGWMVTGGFPKESGNTTEIYTQEWQNFWVWKEGPTMPWEMAGHCQICSSAGVIVAGVYAIKMRLLSYANFDP